ncbi:MAG TPA: oligosaccharide flippase family protein, partial [Bacilli bacterium]|nr:oligosaccharide flippase family protein [Bacilli bacterium]
MSGSKLLRGTMLLTAATFISKFLGMLYVIPFTAIVGGEGIALYQFGYLPYTVILLLATMGIPMAVSKFVSKYNALGDYEIGHRLFKSGLLVMTCTGMIAFILMYTLAPAIASGIFNDPTKLEGNSLEDIVFTIRMVSTALIIVPFMSIIRGYFQGHQSMGPTALSQVIEQVVRIIFILVVAFTIIKLMDGDIGTAVGWATFGAFVGAPALIEQTNLPKLNPDA